MNTNMTDNERMDKVESYFKIPETKELNDLVTKFFMDNGYSPFVNIEMKDEDSNEMILDLDAKFEKEASLMFPDNLQEVLNDYLTSLMMSLADDPQAMDELKEQFKAEAEAKEALDTEDVEDDDYNNDHLGGMMEFYDSDLDSGQGTYLSDGVYVREDGSLYDSKA